jgi:hypothetical protein
MPHTSRSTVVAKAIYTLLSGRKVELGIDEVYYGDHNNIPVGKAITVTPGNKRRELAGVSGPGGRGMNNMEILLLVYFSILDDEASARYAVDLTAENVEDILHEDTTLNGIIIHGFVSDWIPGVIHKPGSQFRVVQLNYQAKTKTNITIV